MINSVTDAAQARFWAGLGAARRRELQALPDWEARLNDALDQPRQAGSGDWLARDDFSAELARSLEGDDAAAVRWWDHLRPADLYLACACARGVAPAIAAFESVHGAEIARTARRFERPGLPAEDLLQVLRTKLFIGSVRDAAAATPAERPRIASYTGQGFLQNWVRVTTTRTFIDCCRARGDEAEIPTASDLMAALPEPAADPELRLLKKEHALHFKAAFADAVAALDSADRVVLKHQLVERLTIDQIGALYHLHRATAARRLASARQALLDGVRAALANRLGLSPERLATLLHLVASRLEISVERLLR